MLAYNKLYTSTDPEVPAHTFVVLVPDFSWSACSPHSLHHCIDSYRPWPTHEMFGCTTQRTEALPNVKTPSGDGTWSVNIGSCSVPVVTERCKITGALSSVTVLVTVLQPASRTPGWLTGGSSCH